MDRIKVTSQMIRSVGYDKAGRVLEVEFSNASVYQYKGVEESVHRDMMRGKSIGQYFIANVKNRYNCDKIA